VVFNFNLIFHSIFKFVVLVIGATAIILQNCKDILSTKINLSLKIRLESENPSYRLWQMPLGLFYMCKMCRVWQIWQPFVINNGKRIVEFKLQTNPQIF